MYLSFPTLSSLQTNAPQLVASFGDGFGGFTKYLLDSGKKALADIKSSPLAGRVNWKIALPVCLLVLAATSCIFYLAKRNNALKAQVDSLAKNKATISTLKRQIKTLEQEKEKLASELAQKIEELSKHNLELNELNTIIGRLQETVEPLQKELESLKIGNSTANVRIEELSKANSKLAELEKTIQQLNAKISSLEAETMPEGGEESGSSTGRKEGKTDPNKRITELEEKNRKLTAQWAEANKRFQTERESSDKLFEELKLLKKDHTALSKTHSELQESSSAMYNNSSVINKEIRELKERNEVLEATLQKIVAEGQEDTSFSEE